MLLIVMFVASFSELFISEVTDASAGSLTYVEIFNATGATVDMTNYEVRITNNGSFDTDIPLTGSLAPWRFIYFRNECWFWMWYCRRRWFFSRSIRCAFWDK